MAVDSFFFCVSKFFINYSKVRRVCVVADARSMNSCKIGKIFRVGCSLSKELDDKNYRKKIYRKKRTLPHPPNSSPLLSSLLVSALYIMSF